MPIQLASFREARFKLRLAVRVAPDAEADKVMAAVGERLRGAFGFDSRIFGQGVSVDEVAAVAHTVAGVEAVQVEALHRIDTPVPSILPRLFAALPVASLTDTPLAAELLLIDDATMTLELMS